MRQDKVREEEMRGCEGRGDEMIIEGDKRKRGERKQEETRQRKMELH